MLKHCQSLSGDLRLAHDDEETTVRTSRGAAIVNGRQHGEDDGDDTEADGGVSIMSGGIDRRRLSAGPANPSIGGSANRSPPPLPPQFELCTETISLSSCSSSSRSSPSLSHIRYESVFYT